MDPLDRIPTSKLAGHWWSQQTWGKGEGPTTKQVLKQVKGETPPTKGNEEPTDRNLNSQEYQEKQEKNVTGLQVRDDSR